MKCTSRLSSRPARAVPRYLVIGLRYLVTVLIGLLPVFTSLQCQAEFQAGAVAVDITPVQRPVIVNGNMVSRSVSEVKSRLHARAIVCADGAVELAIVIVDSCMLPRDFLDDVKGLIKGRTGIDTEHIMISATHTHTAPASMGCLGSDADPSYVPYLRERLVHAVASAQQQLQPARIGFGQGSAAQFTALRRWIRRPDRIATDPFGNPTVRANMHAGRNWDDVTGESGPEDPMLSMISIQTLDGQPLSVLANFSMHYFGDRDISADYFGLFSEGLREAVGGGDQFVGILSHGCSGDIWRRDYTLPAAEQGGDQTIDDYTAGLLEIAAAIYKSISYRESIQIGMEERRLPMRYRVPDAQRLEWARRIVEAMQQDQPMDRTEVYAREQILLHEKQTTEIVVQAIRLGEIAIATTPNETYAITGLKIKAASPLKQTMVIELANGGDGYIPPVEQHRLGGYNTWPARSAGLEVSAESRVTQTCIELLEAVTGKSRNQLNPQPGLAGKLMENLQPAAWWRLHEFTGPRAFDSSGHHRDAILEPMIVPYLEGPDSRMFAAPGHTNRCAMFAGGRLRTHLYGISEDYSVSLWIWNGMPADARAVSGWFYSRGPDHGLSKDSEHLGVAGTDGPLGRLVFQSGPDSMDRLGGKTEISRWSWHHVALVRSGRSVSVYLDGKLEIESTKCSHDPRSMTQFFLGGRSDRVDNWEGRLDEAAIFDRALSAGEVRRLSGVNPIAGPTQRSSVVQSPEFPVP